MKRSQSPIFLILFLGCIFLASCGSESPQAKSDLDRISDPNVPSGGLGTLVAGNNNFAVDLYQALCSSGDNLFYSPYSISLALAMAYGGARGSTAIQMAEVLHFDLPQESLHPTFNQLDLNLDLAGSTAENGDDSQPMQLNIANAIWGQEGYSFLPEYLDLMAQYYGAGIQLADFSQADLSASQINRWISEQTHNLIQDVVNPDGIGPLTRIILVNAIYFKADWRNPFDEKNTDPEPFYLLSGSKVEVQMMKQGLLDLPYMRGENYQAVRLPYAGRPIVMEIILPDEGQFTAFEASLDWSVLNDIFRGMNTSLVNLKMPKFNIRSRFHLADTLTAMGMSDAFTLTQADFSGMDGSDELFLGGVLHEAYVTVDEKGAEAAAVTVIEATMEAVPEEEIEIIELIIDRPFIFLIRDLSTGQILFVGRVLNPAQ